MSVGWPLLTGLLGVVVGPLLGIATDRLIDRVPPAWELRCAHCGGGLGVGSLIPVLHWRQACDGCSRTMSFRYVAVDVLSAVVFAVLVIRFGVSLKLIPYLALGAVLVVLSVVDAETFLLPNIVVWPSVLAALLLTFGLSQLLDGSRFFPALIGGLLFGGFIGVSHVVYAAGMGRGDVKLALLLGILVGWVPDNALDAIRLVLYSLVLALLGGALLGSLFNTITKRGRAEIPFGPALAAASLTMIVASSAILGEVGS